MKRGAFTFAFMLTCTFASVAHAHVGSPDVVHEGMAGPYKLLVAVRPPEVIPGVAEIEVQTSDGDVGEVRLVPTQIGRDAAKFAPTPDVAQKTEGAQHWTGRLWMMAAGSWQVRVFANGARGSGELAVPVPALPQRTKGMQRALGAALLALLVLLAVAGASIVGAAAGEAQLEPGAALAESRRRRVRIIIVLTLLATFGALWGGRMWWNDEEAAYGRYVYKPLAMEATLADGKLRLDLRDPGWLASRRLDDLVPDHDHLMHLFAVRTPALDRVYHLHPVEEAEGRFVHALPPALEAGRYALFADVVHATGLAETAVAEIDLPSAAGEPLLPDDAAGPDGATLRWGERAPLAAGQLAWLRFRADGPLELYMGMLGHAAVIRDDLSVFAHLHPSGSVPMAALAVAANDPHAGHTMHADAQLPSEVAFPYRFPRAGHYKLFIQTKQRGLIHTTAFDADVR
jgi:hypothetical protein